MPKNLVGQPKGTKPPGKPGRIKLKLNSVACSPQANYTDRAAAACQRS
jgi:hypothetical protein